MSSVVSVTVKIQGLDALRRNFQRAPDITLKYLAKATLAAIYATESVVDEGGIMQFKAPRSRRTGQLVVTWGLNRKIERGGLRGETGPTRTYAPYVYFGARGRSPNRYMDRIAKASEPAVQKHFQEAVDKIVEKTAKI